ncbi:Cytochrome P450 [Dillenia turbinata]|uniref:Cytochrome P450 n=1 Tax=Dillenia turbinata TaxID=194707 RepID=A0AAN8VK31_9MAGN
MILFSSLFLGLLLSIIIFLQKTWFTPLRIQNLMRSQGIRGPSYRFPFGNAKEIISMYKESLSNPMDLSPDISARLLPHAHAYTKVHGRNTLIWLGPQPQLITMDSKIIREMTDRKHEAHRNSVAQRFLEKLFGDGLVLSKGEKWTKVRKIADHAFHGESLKNMVPAMIASAEAMVERWKDYEGKEIEVFEEFKVLTSEVISRTAFGSSYLQGKDIFEMLAKLTVIVFRNSFQIRLPGINKIIRSSDDIESEKLERGIRGMIVQIVKKREEKVERGEMEDYGSDFLGVLIKAHHDADKKKRISLQDLIDECKTFYSAGNETTTGLLSWTVLLLAIHKDWQEKARKEVLELFGQDNPNSDGINKMKMMTMIINESLRLYPPAIGTSRTTSRKVRVGKLILPANIDVFIPIIAIHHDPKIWGPDALLFKPERFSSGVAKATNSNLHAFLPFGQGPRICVGSNFAVTEAKIALSMILQRYLLTLSPAYIHSPSVKITIEPQHGIQVVLKALWNCQPECQY